MPVVVTYIWSALPCSTTLVSPPAMRTPASRAAFAMARTSASSTGVGSPASSTKVTTRASARAPDTARSFTVPFTASSPIDPPGKRQRFHDKAVSRDCDCGAVDIDVRGISQRPGGRSKEQWSKKTFDQLAAGLASGSVSHLDLGVAKPDGRRTAHRDQPDRLGDHSSGDRGQAGRHCCLPVFVVVISGA